MLAQFHRSPCPVGRRFERGDHAHDIGQILGTGPIALFLAACGFEQPEILDQQGTYARRPAKFMPGHDDQICIRQRHLANGLGAICEKVAAMIVHDLGQRIEILDHACFIIDRLHCHQRGAAGAFQQMAEIRGHNRPAHSDRYSFGIRRKSEHHIMLDG